MPSAPPSVPLDSPHLDTRVLVKRVADELLSDGQRPTVANVRARTRRGSASTINAALQEWWQELAARIARAQSQPDMPEAIIESASRLWSAALEQAHDALAVYRAETDKKVAHAEENNKTALLACQQADERYTVLTESHSRLDQVRMDLERRLATESSRREAEEHRTHELKAELQQATEEAKQRHAYLEQRLEREHDQYAVMEKRLFTQADEHKTARIQAEQTLRDKINSWREQESRLQKQLQELHERHANAQGRIVALDKQAESLTSKLNQLQAGKEMLIGRASGLEAKLDHLTEAENTWRTQIGAQEKRLVAIREERDALRHQVEEFQISATKLREENQLLKMQLGTP